MRRDGPTTPRGGTFRSLRVRNFRLFVLGQLVSTNGTWMQSVAAPILVLQLTHSGVALGVDTGLTFLPILLFGPWGGLIADRFDTWRVQVACQLAFAVPAALLWVLTATGAVEVWMVFVLSFLTGCVTAVDMPTRQSFYLEMVGRDDLTNAMSLNTATFTGSRATGPALAGVLIAALGVAPVFLINALSYLAVVGALLAMRRDELHPRQRAARARGQIREGLRYVWRTADLRLPLLVMGIVFLFGFNYQVLLPLLAVRTFDGDAGTLGWMLAAFGVGSLAGSLVMASRATTPNPPRLARLAVAAGLLTAAVGLAPWLPLEWLVLPFAGGVSISFAITGNSTLQLTSTDEMRGRVMSLYSVVLMGTTPLGGPLSGAVGESLGAPAALVGAGAITALAGVYGLAAVRRARAPELSSSTGRTASS